MFPLQKSELQIDNHSMISTFIYSIDNERLFKREEHRENKHIDPYYLSDDHAVIIGEELAHPFKVKRLVGQSGMSYGSLGGRAITALSQGLACWHMDEYRKVDYLNIILKVAAILFIKLDQVYSA